MSTNNHFEYNECNDISDMETGRCKRDEHETAAGCSEPLNEQISELETGRCKSDEHKTVAKRSEASNEQFGEMETRRRRSDEHKADGECRKAFIEVEKELHLLKLSRPSLKVFGGTDEWCAGIGFEPESALWFKAMRRPNLDDNSYPYAVRAEIHSWTGSSWEGPWIHGNPKGALHSLRMDGERASRTPTQWVQGRFDIWWQNRAVLEDRIR